MIGQLCIWLLAIWILYLFAKIGDLIITNKHYRNMNGGVKVTPTNKPFPGPPKKQPKR